MPGPLLKGIAVSSGVARGTAFVLVAAHNRAVPRREIRDEEIPHELERFDAALQRAETELAALRRSLSAQLPTEAEIFAAQALLVRSAQLVDPVRARVREERLNVEAALSEVLDDLTSRLAAVADPVLRERAADIRDVGKRLLSLLVTEPPTRECIFPEESVLVADELLPSVSARLELGRVRALVTERGGRSSHASILARARGLTAVAGIADATERIKTGDRVIVDGIAGVVFVDPDAKIAREYDRVEADIRAHRDELLELVELPSVTMDGTSVPLLANVNAFADTEAADRYRADGIGLYRTEFGFVVRPKLPTEDEQYEFLERAAARFAPRPVTFRLLDVGGDKELPTLPLPHSRNPSLSQRGIRLLLQHPELLRTQLAAFLRVGARHPVSILIPVVGDLQDVRRTRAIIREVQSELRARGERSDRETPIGAMIEVPAAALMVGALAREVDFFSLGTNDLAQYVLAVDREDERVADYYQPLHPSLLRLIGSVAEAARRAGRELTICGEMAGVPANVELLLGLGLRRFSVAPSQLLEVKNAIRTASVDDAERLARHALELDTSEEIEALLDERYGSSSPLTPASRQ
ncbi:MAG TPA: phosphoenolpyruvate--protein phosphotransferase [Polyangia bacterium]|nr:phosphoenolpyruvate--protein phosphotransferase [Polyangia bacterium]